MRARRSLHDRRRAVPDMRIGNVADPRKGRNAQPRRAHRDERDVLDRLVALHRPGRDFAGHAVRLQFPLRDSPAFGAQYDGGILGGEGLRRGFARLHHLKRLLRFLHVQDQPVIPGRSRVDFLRRELVCAAFTDPALTDLERVRQRASADGHGVAILFPDLRADLHGQRQYHLVVGAPRALHDQPAARGVLGRGKRLAVHADGGVGAPRRHAKHEREPDRLRRLHRNRDGFVERIIGGLGQLDLGAIGDLGLHLARRVHYHRQAIIARRHPQVLGKVRPSERRIVLTAAVLVRVVTEHVAAVLNHGRLIGAVELNLVGTRDIVQPLEIRGHRCREGIESDLLGPVRPCAVAGDPHQHLVAEHHLDPGARFGAVARSIEPRPRVLVGRIPAAGDLAVKPAHRIVVAHRGFQVSRVFGLLEELRRLAETFGEIHVVPGSDAARPIVGALVVHPRQVEQPGLARAVVEPVDGIQVVARALLLPACRKQVLQGNGRLPAKVLRQERYDARIAGRLIERAQREEHHHVGPQIEHAAAHAVDAFAIDVALAAEIAIGPLGGDHRIQPLVGALDDRLVPEHVAEVHITAKPVRHLFPPELPLAGRAGPFVAFELAELADLFQLAREALGLQNQLAPQPAFRAHAPQRELHEGVRRKRRAIAGIVAVCALRRWFLRLGRVVYRTEEQP